MTTPRSLKLKRVPELWVLHVREIILIRVIETLHCTCGVASAVVPNADIPVYDRQECGSNRCREHHDKARSIHGSIRRFEEEWPDKISWSCISSANKSLDAVGLYRDSTQRIFPKKSPSALYTLQCSQSEDPLTRRILRQMMRECNKRKANRLCHHGEAAKGGLKLQLFQIDT
jgi:hypothetical protein